MLSCSTKATRRLSNLASKRNAALQQRYLASETLNIPSFAPRPRPDVKSIRQNPHLYSQNCSDRNNDELKAVPAEILRLFDQWSDSQRRTLALRKDNNAIQAQLSHGKAPTSTELNRPPQQEEGRDSLLKRAQQLKESLRLIEARESLLNSQIESLALQLPNLTSSETPLGNEPRILEYLNGDGEAKSQNDPRGSERDHVRLGTEFDLLDFSHAAAISGWGWYYLKHEAALLEQALIAYAIHVAVKHGYCVVSPPTMIYDHISTACGFRPRDRNQEQQTYAIQSSERDKDKEKASHVLAATAEIPLAGMNANMILDAKDLPLQMVAASRCYRAEAGARGAQTRGLYRVHEFSKVEMFIWTHSEDSPRAFGDLVSVQKEILEGLGLHCRVLEMPTADLGASAFRKIDIEARIPSRSETGEGWGEVTSVSNCTDYQSRRLNTKIKTADGMKFAHTLNGTALAVPRVLAALIEYGWEPAEHCIKLPEVLWPWMHGVTCIKKKEVRAL